MGSLRIRSCSPTTFVVLLLVTGCSPGENTDLIDARERVWSAAALANDVAYREGRKTDLAVDVAARSASIRVLELSAVRFAEGGDLLPVGTSRAPCREAKMGEDGLCRLSDLGDGCFMVEVHVAGAQPSRLGPFQVRDGAQLGTQHVEPAPPRTREAVLASGEPAPTSFAPVYRTVWSDIRYDLYSGPIELERRAPDGWPVALEFKYADGRRKLVAVPPVDGDPDLAPLILSGEPLAGQPEQIDLREQGGRPLCGWWPLGGPLLSNDLPLLRGLEPTTGAGPFVTGSLSLRTRRPFSALELIGPMSDAGAESGAPGSNGVFGAQVIADSFGEGCFPAVPAGVFVARALHWNGAPGDWVATRVIEGRASEIWLQEGASRPAVEGTTAGAVTEGTLFVVALEPEGAGPATRLAIELTEEEERRRLDRTECGEAGGWLGVLAAPRREGGGVPKGGVFRFRVEDESADLTTGLVHEVLVDGSMPRLVPIAVPCSSTSFGLPGERDGVCLVELTVDGEVEDWIRTREGKLTVATLGHIRARLRVRDETERRWEIDVPAPGFVGDVEWTAVDEVDGGD